MTSAVEAADPGATDKRFLWRRLGSSELDIELIWSGVFFLGVGVAVAVPAALLLKLFCPFKALTGLPCATCGSGRTMMALMHLEPLSALQLNPGATIVWIAWAMFATYGAMVVLLRLPRLRIHGLRLTRGLVTAGMLVAAVNWAYLIVTGV